LKTSEPRSARTITSLRVGDVVEVRSAQEILATLDENGEYEDMPFTPEMLEFCGRRMVVHKSAHKLCEVITGEGGLHWLNRTVHLKDSRCNGAAHGGCQTDCSLYWKEAWLRRVTPGESTATEAKPSLANLDVARLTRATKKAPYPDGTERYSCQATEILRTTSGHIRFLDPYQYLADLKTGNVGLFAVLRTFLFGLFNAYQRRSRKHLPRWLLIKEGLSWGFVKGCASGATPTVRLDLEVGDLVRVKSKEEIVLTLNSKRLNRGLGFEEEQARACGTTARVMRRVDRCIDERTGKLLTMKNPCIVLEGVVCRGVYHGNCPREYVPFWRELWLERVHSNRPQPPTQGQSSA
jgi:hypothetical protein